MRSLAATSESRRAPEPGNASVACDPPEDMAALIRWVLSNPTTLSKVSTRITRFALEHPAEIAMSNGRRVAGLLDVSPSSVTRFAAALGFQNYTELRRFFQREVIRARQARN
jgi:DNA-binding MurR/RpiR family transcriptional regulator